MATLALPGAAARWHPALDWSSPGVQITSSLVLLTIVATVTLLPVMFVVAGSFDLTELGQRGHWGLGVWQKMLTSEQSRKALGNSFLLALRAPVGAVVAFCLAWLLIRFQVPGRGVIEGALWFAFFLPALPVTLGWMLLLDPQTGLINQLP